MAKECCKYGTENESSEYPLARASLHLGNSYELMENERETLLAIYSHQVILSEISFCFPLNDADIFDVLLWTSRLPDLPVAHPELYITMLSAGSLKSLLSVC